VAITGGPRRNIGNWAPLKLKGYSYAVRSDLGLAMIAVAALGLVVFLAAKRFSAGAGLRSAVVSPVEDHPAGGPYEVKRALTPVPPLPQARYRPVPGLAAGRSGRGGQVSR